MLFVFEMPCIADSLDELLLAAKTKAYISNDSAASVPPPQIFKRGKINSKLNSVSAKDKETNLKQVAQSVSIQQDSAVH